MNKREFLIELARIVEADADAVKETTPLSELAGWDSMATMTFLAMVDKRLGVVLDPKRLTQCGTVGDLIGLVSAHLTD